MSTFCNGCSFFVRYKLWLNISATFHLVWLSDNNSTSICAPSSEFVSSSIPSWQTLTAHAQPFSGDRDLAFCLKVPLDSLLVWASSEGSGETARMRRLAWTFAARIGDKYQIRLTRSNYNCEFFNNLMHIVSIESFIPCFPMLYSGLLLKIWAATWQNQQNQCAPSEDSDQPSLIRVFAFRMGVHSFCWVCHVVAHFPF